MKAEDAGPTREQHGDMMRQHVQLCVLAGLDIRGKDLLEIFILAGAIIDDRALTQRAICLARAERSDSIVPGGTRERVLREMTEHDKALLRERVLDVRPIRKDPEQASHP